jgi:hypothetical protein
MTPEELMERADLDLLAAKSDPGGRVGGVAPHAAG